MTTTDRQRLLGELVDTMIQATNAPDYETKAKAEAKAENIREALRKDIRESIAGKRLQRAVDEQDKAIKARAIADMLAEQQATKRSFMTPSQRLGAAIETKLARFGARVRRFGR